MVKAHGFEHIDIDMMSSSGICLPEIQMNHDDIYKGCARGRRIRGGLNIVHWDVCVTMSSTSLTRYVHYVDDLDLFLGEVKMNCLASSRNPKSLKKISLKRR